MKHTAIFLLTIFFSLSTFISYAQNQAVIIPLFKSKEIQNVVLVAKSGGDFTNPVAAVNSITGASVDNPYLVIIGPGIFTLTEPLVMKSYISIAGSGQKATKLTGAISSGSYPTSSIITGADYGELSKLTIENTGGDTLSITLYNDNTSPLIENVTATASGGTLTNYGILNINSAAPTMMNMTVTASGGTYCYGTRNFSSGAPTMINVTSTASGGTNSYGVGSTSGSSVIIKQSTISGETTGITNQSSVTRVIRSSIFGGVVNDSGTLSCINSDDGVDTALDATCQ